MSKTPEEPLSDDDMSTTTPATAAPAAATPTAPTAETPTAPTAETPTAPTAVTPTAPTATPPTRPTATHPDRALDLLSGDAQTFLEKVWASRVHLHRADPADLVGLLSLDDADHLLTSTAIRTPSVRLAKDGAVLPESAYTRTATLAGKPLTGLVDAAQGARRSSTTARPSSSRACTATGRR